MLGGFLGLGLEIERAFEALCACIIARHPHKSAEVVELQRHIGVEQGVIALSAAPEHVAVSAEFECGVDARLDLCRRDGEDIGIGAGGGARHKLLVAEVVGGVPKKFLAVLFLQAGDVVHHLVEVRDALRDGPALGSDVDVMEAIIVDLQLVHELEGKVRLLAVHRHRVVLEPETLVYRAGAEHIHAFGVDGVPVAHREFEVLAHRLAEDDLVRVVKLESERIFGSFCIHDFFDFVIAFHDLPRMFKVRP